MNPICPWCKEDQVYEAFDHKTRDYVLKCPDCGESWDIEEQEADHE